MIRTLLILTVAQLFLITAYANKNPVVARVNGTKITLDELNANFNNAKLFVTDKVVTKSQVLEELINRSLGIDKAKEKLNENPLVRSKMEDVLYHAQLSKDLENEFTKITVEDGEIEQYYRKFQSIALHIFY